MKKNVPGQAIGAQMVAAADGTAFTSAVTVYVTGDGGTQAVGSVGAGACTHEGNGFHSYAPAQAETNYDHIAFTFIGTGAIPSTVQVYTMFPQTGDVFPLASTEIADIKTKTDQLTFGTANRVNAQVYGAEADSITAGVIATDAIGANELAASAITEIQAGLSTLDAAGVRTAVGLASANLDTQVGDLPTNAELATALGTGDDAVLAAIAALNNLSQANIRTAMGLASANLDTQLDALPTNAELTTALASADDAVLAAIAALNNVSTAQVNAEMVDVLSTDTQAELASVPAANASLALKIGWLFLLARNKITQTSTTQLVRNDADAATVGTSTVSDDAVTTTRGKFS